MIVGFLLLHFLFYLGNVYVLYLYTFWCIIPFYVYIYLLWISIIRTELCRFSGAKIYPGRGIRFIRSDSQVDQSIMPCHLLFSSCYQGYETSLLALFRFSSLLTRNARGTSTIAWGPPSLPGPLCTVNSTRRWISWLHLLTDLVKGYYCLWACLFHRCRTQQLKLWRRGAVPTRSRTQGPLSVPLWKSFRRRDPRSQRSVMLHVKLPYGMRRVAI